MANALNRNLAVGDKVILHGGVTAVVDAMTFGAMSFTSGRCLGVKIGGKSERVDGYDIDAEATMKCCAEANGWDTEKSTT